MQFDITIVICATDLVEAYHACQSIQSTSGLDCQFLIHDNSTKSLPLAKVYNMYGKVAQAEYILFVHQDVEFSGKNWGKKIIKKLNEKNVGCIGYAGSVHRPTNYYAGWPINVELSRNNYRQVQFDNLIYHSKNVPFDEVVVIDGLAMFCRKDVFLTNQFDESLLDGFHCYDIDFSLSLHKNGYKNYVFTDKESTIFHKSCGAYNAEWVKQTLKMTNAKWNKLTPASTLDYEESDQVNKDIQTNNNAFIANIKRFFDAWTAMQMIHQLPFKEQQMKEVADHYTMYLKNNGYRDWN